MVARPWFPPTRHGGPRMRRGGPYAHRSMFAANGSHPDGRGAPKISRNGLAVLQCAIAAQRNCPNNARKWDEKVIEPGSLDQADAMRARARVSRLTFR